MSTVEKLTQVAEALSARSARIRSAGIGNVTIGGSVPPVGKMEYERKPEKMGYEAKKKRTSWSCVTYCNSDFRRTVMQFDDDRNLSRFVYRTAKMNHMDEVTLSDVRKMIAAADETIWILKGDHRFRADNPDMREETWVMQIDGKAQYVALMKIVNAGFATTDKRPIKVQDKDVEQRYWTLLK